MRENARSYEARIQKEINRPRQQKQEDSRPRKRVPGRAVHSARIQKDRKIEEREDRKQGPDVEKPRKNVEKPASKDQKVRSGALAKLDQDLPGRCLERLQNAHSFGRDCFIDRFPFHQKQLLEPLCRKRVGEIPLVELQHVRNLIQVEALFFQIQVEVGERFEVCIQPLFLRVCHEHNPIHPFENQFAAGIVKHLSVAREIIFPLFSGFVIW